jgi:hypothetical protein
MGRRDMEGIEMGEYFQPFEILVYRVSFIDALAKTVIGVPGRGKRITIPIAWAQRVRCENQRAAQRMWESQRDQDIKQ